MTEAPRDPRLLLERSERVRALARRLLGVADGAEDVAQEALIASLDWREVGDDPLPARLAAKVRSLASRWRRGSARRARRELAAARPDRAPSVSELCERAALQRTLVDAVLELEEPYRESVLLRYFENQPPRAIARLQGVPVRTVQTRLARALVQLRARLERRVDLSAWLPLLAPLSLRPTSSSPLAPLSAGALAVTQTKFVAALMAVALIGSAALFLRPGGEPALPVARTGATSSSGPGPAAVDGGAATPTLEGLDSPLARAPASVATTPATRPGAWSADRELDLFGEVVDGFDQPLADVQLLARAQAFEDCIQPGQGGVLAETRSDSEGRFKLRLEHGRTCALEAAQPGFATALLTDLRAGERVRVVLGPAAGVFGRVTRALDGSGVSGARLRLRQRPEGFATHVLCLESVTDSDGNYAFEALSAGLFEVHVSCPADPDLWPPAVRLEPGQVLEHDLVVPPGVEIAGRVIDAATGLGIVDAEVGLHAFFEGAQRSGADGAFLLRGWAPDEPGRAVYARAEGYAQAQLDLQRNRLPQGEVELRLDAARGVFGRVLDPVGRPLPGARIELHGVRPPVGVPRDRVSVSSDADGRFEVAGLTRSGGHTLVASFPGAGRLVVDLPDFDPERDPLDLEDLFLPVAASLAGRVVDASGAPLSQAFVTLQGGDPGRNRLRALAPELEGAFEPETKLRLDDLGRFVALDLAPGSYAVSARVTGLAHEARALVQLREGEQEDGLDLVVDLGLAISGRVFGPDGRPFFGAVVEAWPSNGDVTPRAAMNARSDGSFELSGLLAGPHTVSVEQFWFQGARGVCGAQIEAVAAGTRDLRIELPAAATITGWVLDTDGAPLVGASVQIDHGDGQLGGMGAVVVDAQGRFSLRVPAGSSVDLAAVDWSRMAEGVEFIRVGRRYGVRPGSAGVELRIEP